MKGKVENTIPQRQFENIKTTYYFETDEERKQAIEKSINDCLNYLHAVTKRDKEKMEEPEEHHCKIGDVEWRFKDGKWQYLEDKQWK